MTTPRERLTPQVHDAWDAGELARLRLLLANHHPADLADMLERLESTKQFQIFQLLDDELAASVLDEIGRDATRTLLDRLPVEEAAELLGRLPMDDAAEILAEDVPGGARSVTGSHGCGRGGRCAASAALSRLAAPACL